MASVLALRRSGSGSRSRPPDYAGLDDADRERWNKLYGHASRIHAPTIAKGPVSGKRVHQGFAGGGASSARAIAFDGRAFSAVLGTGVFFVRSRPAVAARSGSRGRGRPGANPQWAMSIQNASPCPGGG